MSVLRLPGWHAGGRKVVAVVASGLLLALAACSSQPAAAVTASPAAGATSFTFQAAGKVAGRQVDAVAAIMRARMGTTAGTVTTKGQTVTVTFDAPPSSGMLTSLTSPVDVAVRPVLLASDSPSGAARAAADAGSTPEVDGPSSPSDVAYYLTPAVQDAFDQQNCASPAAPLAAGPADKAVVACAQDKSAKYVLGPVELDGERVSDVTSGRNTLPDGTAGTSWVVEVHLDGPGAAQFATTTSRLQTLSSPLNQLALVVGGVVVSAPAVEETIANGQLVISGSFTEDSAAALAAQIGFQHVPALMFRLTASR